MAQFIPKRDPEYALSECTFCRCGRLLRLLCLISSWGPILMSCIVRPSRLCFYRKPLEVTEPLLIPCSPWRPGLGQTINHLCERKNTLVFIHGIPCPL